MRTNIHLPSSFANGQSNHKSISLTPFYQLETLVFHCPHSYVSTSDAVTIIFALAIFMPATTLGFFNNLGAVCFTNDKLTPIFLSALRFLRETLGKSAGLLLAPLLQHNPGTWRMIVSPRKQYGKTDELCTVTFSLPKAGVASVRTVNIVGDFNGWNKHGKPMKKQKNSGFAGSISLTCGREYQFRIYSTLNTGRTTGKPTNTCPTNTVEKTLLWWFKG